MEHHYKRKGCPRTAYEFFVKLYCKKRGSSSEKNYTILLAAAKAWVTLKEEEKNTFIDKFIQCKEKHKNQLAVCLEKMKPYMKKKPLKRLPDVNRSESLVFKNGVDLQEESPPHTDGHNEDTAFINKSKHGAATMVSEISSFQDQQIYYNIENLDKYEDEESEVPVLPEQEEPVLSEPYPPSVRNSFDLFNMIKNKKGDNNIEWTSLSQEEKKRYRKAVSELKKDYIQNYKRYLESLPLKELFEYYHKTVDK